MGLLLRWKRGGGQTMPFWQLDKKCRFASLTLIAQQHARSLGCILHLGVGAVVAAAAAAATGKPGQAIVLFFIFFRGITAV